MRWFTGLILLSTVVWADGGPVYLKGGTDDTFIGNSSDMLKVLPSNAQDRTGSGTLTALDTTVAANTQGLSTIVFDVTGTWVGTIRLEGTIDGGTTWLLLNGIDSAANVFATFTSNSRAIISCGGYSQIRVRMSAYTSGTANVAWNAGAGVNSFQVFNTNAASMKVQARLQDNAGTAVTLGQKVMASSIPVVVASDQTNLPDNVVQFGGSNVVTGTGNGGAGIPRVTVSNDSSLTNISGTISLPTGAATSANQSTEITALQIIDNLAHGQNASFNNGVPVMGQLDDTSTTAATEDNVAVARITAQRAVHANLRNNAGTEIGTSGAPVRVDPTGTTTQPVNVSQYGGASTTLGQKTMANSIPVVNASDQTGTSAQQVQGTTADAAAAVGNPVFIGGEDPSGNVNAIATDSLGDTIVVGNVDHSATDSGSPVKVGGKFNSALPTNLVDGERSDLQTNMFGELAVQFRNKFSRLTGNATTTVKSGSGRLHAVIVGNNTTGGTATFYDNTAGSGTVIMVLTFGTPSGGLLSSSGQAGPVFVGPAGIEFATGLTVVRAGSTSNDITVLYQ